MQTIPMQVQDGQDDECKLSIEVRNIGGTISVTGPIARALMSGKMTASLVLEEDE